MFTNVSMSDPYLRALMQCPPNTGLQTGNSQHQVAFCANPYNEAAAPAKKNNNWLYLGLAALAGAGIYFLTKGKAKTQLSGSTTLNAPERAVNLVKQEFAQTGNRTKPVQEWIDTVIGKEKPVLKGKKRTQRANAYKRLWDSKKHKQLEELADKRIAQRARQQKAYNQACEDFLEKQEFFTDKNRNLFNEVFNEIV